VRIFKTSLVLFALAASAGSHPSSGAPWQSASLGNAVISVDRMAPDMRDAYLRSIRTELQAHGYSAAQSGKIGRAALAGAIRHYQRDAGLPVDGMASKELLDHLMFALPKIYAGRRPQHLETAPEVVARRTEPVRPRARSNGGLMPGFKGLPREPVIARTLPSPSKPLSQPSPRTGGSGVVTQLQRHLASRGYYHGKIDGVFDDEFAVAVRKYQKDKKLPVTGVIDGPLLNEILPHTTPTE
jgi:peptidoglycan hydrolase-like protein with peptidoglycan-binding domain